MKRRALPAADSIAFGTRETIMSLPLPPPTWWEWLLVALAVGALFGLIVSAAFGIAWWLRV